MTSDAASSRFTSSPRFFGVLAALLFLSALGTLVGGIAFADWETDTPLAVKVDEDTVKRGKSITGAVVHPDGDITVSLRRLTPKEIEQPLLVDQDIDNPRTTICDYDEETSTFECAVADVKKTGVYLVQVTDQAQPGEGTAMAPVKVTKR